MGVLPFSEWYERLECRKSITKSYRNAKKIQKNICSKTFSGLNFGDRVKNRSQLIPKYFLVNKHLWRILPSFWSNNKFFVYKQIFISTPSTWWIIHFSVKTTMERLPVFSFKRQQKWFKNTFTSSDDGKIFGNLLLMTSGFVFW